jgi:hypothetical protein
MFFDKKDMSKPLVTMPISDLKSLLEWLDMCERRDAEEDSVKRETI